MTGYTQKILDSWPEIRKPKKVQMEYGGSLQSYIAAGNRPPQSYIATSNDQLIIRLPISCPLISSGVYTRLNPRNRYSQITANYRGLYEYVLLKF